MTSLLFAAVLGCLYIALRRRDARMLRNGLVLVAAAWFGLLGASQVLAQWLPWIRWLGLGIVVLAPLAVMVLAAFLIGNGATMLHREGRSLGNLLSLLAGLALLGLPVLGLLLVSTLNPVALGVAALLFFICCYFGVVFVVFLAYAVVYVRMAHGANPDVVVILGSQVNGDQVPPLLRSRLDKALEIYREADPATPPLLIPSGGQGAGESHPEGAVMAAYLVDAGAPAHHVAAEQMAVNTAENLQFGAAVAREHGRGGPMLVVTNNYHVLRAALLARKLDINAEVAGSPTARYFLPSAFLREYVAILREHAMLHALLCVPFVALTALFTATALGAG